MSTQTAVEPAQQAPARYTPTTFSVNFNEATVLSTARILHDEKCREGSACHVRDYHASSCFDRQVRTMITALAEVSSP